MSTCKAEESTFPLHLNSRDGSTSIRQHYTRHQFNKDQFYEGDFYKGCLHGQGDYTWRNVGVYEGGFYSNSKEGYASLSFVDNSHFEGLFVKNQPFGPGILTYPNGRQDAGLWMGRKLIRLSRAVDYIIPRLAPTPAGKLKLLQFKYVFPLNEEFCNSATEIVEKLQYQSASYPSPYSGVIYDRRSIFFDKETFDKTYFINHITNGFIKESNDLENAIRFSVELNEEAEESFNLEETQVPSHCLCPQEVFEMNYKNMKETNNCENESYDGELELGFLGYFTKFGTIEGLEKDVEESKILEGIDVEEEDGLKKPKILLWNRSELCKEIIKQMFRFRGFEEKLNFNLAKLMLGVRNAFRRTGEKERQCLQLLKMCSTGPPHAVKDLLCSYEISPDLTDCRGNNSLMFAAAADQHEIIDILLDYGVDIDNFNDESLTALNLCLLRRLALTYKISNWETSFLPKEIDPVLTENTEFQTLQSIASLDRTFGDGMSIYDSKTQIQDDRFLALLPAAIKESICSMSIKSHSIFDDFETLNISQITILDLMKSPENYSLVTDNDDETKLQSFCSFRTVDPSQKIESNDATLKIKLIPKPIKREEFEKSIKKASTDNYLFEFTFKKNPNLDKKKEKEKEGTTKSSKAVDSGPQEKKEEKEGTSKSSKAKSHRTQEKEEKHEDTEKINVELNERLQAIDKTVKTLLKRGADPNISEVPKPSIHLGVYTKDLNTVCLLLRYGANPNVQLYPNEGLLTPLHVIVLREPDPINVKICECLINFEADPELETSPDFTMCEEEKKLLVSEYGRTPLQLLCMRPDLEFADPDDNLIKIGFLLAKVSNKKHFYNGHSCITLAMLTGNFKILKALLDSKLFNPNTVLGNDRGTALHVLVSTEYQKITSYENSIKMCDMLISKGADPLKTFSYPEKLAGTCIDYGYREIDEEKKARKANMSAKKESKGSKIKGKTAAKDYLKNHEKIVEYLHQIAKNIVKDKETEDSVKKSNRTACQENESEKDIKIKEKEESLVEKHEHEINKKLRESRSTRHVIESMHSVRTEVPELKESEAQIKKENVYSVEKSLEITNKDKKSKDKTLNEKSLEEVCKPECKNSENKKKPKHTKKKNLDDDEKRAKKSARNKKEMVKTEEQERTEKQSVKNKKGVCKTRQRTAYERFPEKIRMVLLQVYGTSLEFDINKLLMPYVVLRDGDLYYKFHKKQTSLKEQYSLI